MGQPVAPGRLYGCHLDCVDRADPQSNGFSHIIIDMPFSLYILNMFVICTKTEPVRADMVLNNSLYNVLQVPGSAALPDENGHSVSPLPHCIGKIRALMVCRYSRHHICL